MLGILLPVPHDAGKVTDIIEDLERVTNPGQTSPTIYGRDRFKPDPESETSVFFLYMFIAPFLCMVHHGLQISFTYILSLLITIPWIQQMKRTQRLNNLPKATMFPWGKAWVCELLATALPALCPQKGRGRCPGMGIHCS